MWVEEIDALAPEQSNQVIMTSGESCRCGLVCDLMHLEGAESLGVYGEDFYKGMPAATRNGFGKGHVYYVGTRMEEQGLAHILDQAAGDAQVESIVSGGEGLEIVCRRTREGRRLYFVMNFTDQERKLPACFAGHRDLLTGTAAPEDRVLKKYDVCIIEMEA